MSSAKKKKAGGKKEAGGIQGFGGGVTSTCPGEFRKIIWQAQRHYWHRHGQRIRNFIRVNCDESLTSCC